MGRLKAVARECIAIVGTTFPERHTLRQSACARTLSEHGINNNASRGLMTSNSRIVVGDGRDVLTAPQDAGGEITVFTLGAKLLERRWTIFRWMLAVGVIAAGVVLFRPALYRASASFVSQAPEGNRSNLAALAEGFGVNISAANQTSSPDFYVKLVK